MAADNLNDESGQTRPVKQHAGLEAPQFRLSTLMLLVTGLCVLLASAMVLPPLMTFAAVLLLLAILAHVAGNFYGTKLRDGATELNRRQRLEGVSQTRNDLATKPTTTSSRLGDRAPIGIALGLSVAAGAMIAISIGCYCLSTAATEPIKWPDYVVSSIAFGVLGGIFGFMLGGFACIAFRAWSDAIKGTKQPARDETTSGR